MYRNIVYREKINMTAATHELMTITFYKIVLRLTRY